MSHKISSHIRSNVVGYVAVFLALNAGAYAATLAPKNSVVSRSIKNGQVKTKDLANGSVTNPKLATDAVTTFNVLDNSLTGADIDEGTLGTVPNASHATNADTADNSTTLGGIGPGGFAPAQAEGWHEVNPDGGAEPAFRMAEPSVCPTFGCLWTNFDTTHNSAAFYRDPYGRVYLKGLVKCVANDGGANCGGAGSTVVDDIFGLPAGYRPDKEIEFTTSSNGLFARLDVKADGTVSADPPYDYRSLYLDNISFRCAPSGQNGCP